MNRTKDVQGSGKEFQAGDERPLRLAGSTLGHRSHVCAFFNNADEEYRVLLPFIKDAIECGHKVVHTVDPKRRDELIQRLAAEGIDVEALCETGQIELRDWYNTHLRDGQFDQYKTFDLFQGVVKDSHEKGFARIRFVTHMEWAVESGLAVDDLLEYEARANGIWDGQEGPINPVICTYDLTKFGGDVVVDIMRTHPMIIIGGILQENHSYVPTDQFLEELRHRRAMRHK